MESQSPNKNESSLAENIASPENIAAVQHDAPSVPAAPKFDPSPDTRREARRALADGNKLFKAAKKKISAENAKKYEDASAALKKSLDSNRGVDLTALDIVKQFCETTFNPFRKSAAREIIESLLFALAFALVLRTFFIEPFKIPTRSMVPTLLEGDQLFVTKLSYGIRLPFLDKYVVRFSKPQRGEVVVFAFPRLEAAEHLAATNSQCMRVEQLSGEKDYIKRIIGVEGDVIEVIEQVVHVNGEPISQKPFYEHTVIDKFFRNDRRQGFWNHERHGNADFTTITHVMPQNHFGPITVKPGHIFVMGDNRDNSLDSRCWGQVPVDNIKGRAQIIWWSGGSNGPRWDRMFDKIF